MTVAKVMLFGKYNLDLNHLLLLSLVAVGIVEIRWIQVAVTIQHFYA